MARRRQPHVSRLVAFCLCAASLLLGFGIALTLLHLRPVKIACILVQPSLFQKPVYEETGYPGR